jgi:transposase-like protein
MNEKVFAVARVRRIRRKRRKKYSAEEKARIVPARAQRACGHLGPVGRSHERLLRNLLRVFS